MTQVSSTVALDPELARCVVSMGHGDQAILHPLLRNDHLLLTAKEVARINHAFYRQKAAAANALRDRRYVDYVFCYQPRYRFEALRRVVDRYMPIEMKQALLRETYVHAWAYWPDATSWRELLTPYEGRDWWETLGHMTASTVTLWRGGRSEGLNWTTDAVRAVDYAREYAKTRKRVNSNILYSATIPTEWLIASFAPNDYVWLPPASSKVRGGVKLERHPCP